MFLRVPRIFGLNRIQFYFISNILEKFSDISLGSDFLSKTKISHKKSSIYQGKWAEIFYRLTTLHSLSLTQGPVATTNCGDFQLVHADSQLPTHNAELRGKHKENVMISNF